MTTIRDALMKRIAADTGSQFLSLLEEKLVSKFSAVHSYATANFGKELHPSVTGHLQHLHILQETVNAAGQAGLAASMAPTNPKGHYFAKIVTECFVLGCMRIKSEHWNKAKYSRELGQLNSALEPPTPDMFEDITSGKQERIFLVAAVIEDPQFPEVPHISFVVPYSSLDGYHFRATLKELQQVALMGVAVETLEPLPFLKKRLDDAERGNKEA